jgi:Flp pilus assembly protein TadG
MNFLLRRFYHDENGQSLYLVAAALVGLLGVAGLVIDLGWAYHAQRELQASADAAALAGALDLPYNPKTTAINDATTASGVLGDENAVHDLSGVSLANGTPLVECFPACSGSVTTNCVPNATKVPACSYYDATTGETVNTGNVMVVQETGTSPTFFSKVLGWKSLTINVTSVALAKDATVPINIMVVMDSTASMAGADSNCGIKAAAGAWPFSSNPTREDCAKWGIRMLLMGLNSATQSVGLVTFPGVTSTSVANEYNCSTGGVTTVPYSSPNETSFTPYLIVNLTEGYSTTSGGTTTLTTGTDLVDSVYWNAGSSKNTCNASNYGLHDPGGQGTSYEDAIEDAMYAIQNAANPAPTNAIVVLGDGTINDSTSTACQGAITAAQNATAAGISVYSVGYDIPAGNCTSGLTYCQVMQGIASNYGNYYGDAQSQSTTGGNCPASTANANLTDLGDIFTGLAEQFGNTRLLPPSQYTPSSQ